MFSLSRRLDKNELHTELEIPIDNNKPACLSKSHVYWLTREATTLLCGLDKWLALSEVCLLHLYTDSPDQCQRLHLLQTSGVL